MQRKTHGERLAMAMAMPRSELARKFVEATERVERLQDGQGHVAVIKTTGKTSGFDPEERTLWRLELVNHKRDHRIVVPAHTGSYGECFTDKREAEREADQWSALVSWPIKWFVEEQVVVPRLREEKPEGESFGAT